MSNSFDVCQRSQVEVQHHQWNVSGMKSIAGIQVKTSGCSISSSRGGAVKMRAKKVTVVRKKTIVVSSNVSRIAYTNK